MHRLLCFIYCSSNSEISYFFYFDFCVWSNHFISISFYHSISSLFFAFSLSLTSLPFPSLSLPAFYFSLRLISSLFLSLFSLSPFIAVSISFSVFLSRLLSGLGRGLSQLCQKLSKIKRSVTHWSLIHFQSKKAGEVFSTSFISICLFLCFLLGKFKKWVLKVIICLITDCNWEKVQFILEFEKKEKNYIQLNF